MSQANWEALSRRNRCKEERKNESNQFNLLHEHRPRSKHAGPNNKQSEVQDNEMLSTVFSTPIENYFYINSRDHYAFLNGPSW